MSVFLKLGLDGSTRWWFISAGFRNKNKDRGNVLLLTMKHANVQKAVFCIICGKASGAEKRVWLQRAGHCLGGRGGSISMEPAVSWVEGLEHSLMHLNSSLGIFYRLSFKHTKDRSEEGQKYSLVFERNKILRRHFLSIWTHNLRVSRSSPHCWTVCNNLPCSTSSLVVHHHFHN